MLAIADAAVMAAELIKLRADGSGKPSVTRDKITAVAARSARRSLSRRPTRRPQRWRA
jgi:hypothetical protein